MSTTEIDKKTIESLLPHREPMLLIDKLINIIPLKSATAIVYVKKNSFYVQGHFPDQPVMPGVLIVEAFGQAAAALTAHGIDKKEYENKLVFLMGVDKARFRNPVIPDCKLELNIEAIRSHGRVWKYKGMTNEGVVRADGTDTREVKVQDGVTGISIGELFSPLAEITKPEQNPTPQRNGSIMTHGSSKIAREPDRVPLSHRLAMKGVHQLREKHRRSQTPCSTGFPTIPHGDRTAADN